jgi:hypothetical protein
MESKSNKTPVVADVCDICEENGSKYTETDALELFESLNESYRKRLQKIGAGDELLGVKVSWTCYRQIAGLIRSWKHVWICFDYISTMSTSACVCRKQQIFIALLVYVVDERQMGEREKERNYRCDRLIRICRFVSAGRLQRVELENL